MCCYSNQLTIKCFQILRGLSENVGFPSYPINTAACLDDQDTEGTMIDLVITWRLAVPLVKSKNWLHVPDNRR